MFGLRMQFPLLATAILLVAPAKATTTYYVGASGGVQEAAFNTAVGGLTLLNTTLTFSGGDLGSGGLFNANTTGVNFLGFDDFVFNTPTDLAVNSGKLTATQLGEAVKITLPPAGLYGFGFHITMAAGAGSWLISLTPGGSDYSVTNTSPTNVQFFGFVSNAPVTAPLYIRKLGGNPTLVLPDFEAYGAAITSAPEPHTMLLVGLGLVILPMIRVTHWKLRRRA